MVQPGKPFTRRVNLKVDKLYYGISTGGINSYIIMGKPTNFGKEKRTFRTVGWGEYGTVG